MTCPRFTLGFAPFSTTFPAFPTSNVVKAIAIASFAALAVNALLKTVEPLQAGHEHKQKTNDEKVC